MKKLKAIIVDDEPNARSLLQNLISDYCPEIEVIADVEDIKTAVKTLNKNEIDLVFLDVEMPNENGFALFDYFNKPSFETIFCTAYSQYAIHAFEVSATDYLLKPIGIEKLKEAVGKVIEKQKLNLKLNNIEVLKENLAENKIKKIGIHTNNSIVFLEVNDIFYFEADGSYTTIHHKNGKELAVKKIKHFEELLDTDTRFFRTHRSYFVNVTLIEKYSKKEGLTIAYHNGILLPISREKKDEFEDCMHQNNIL